MDPHDRGWRTKAQAPRRWLAITITAAFVAVLIVIVTVSIVVMRVIRHELAAETTLQSTIVTAHAVDLFIKSQDPPRWPASWDELAALEITDHPFIHWPDDRPMIEERVSIDFSLTLAEFAAMDPERFDAIRPIGPVYQGWDWYIRYLIDTAGDAINVEAQSP